MAILDIIGSEFTIIPEGAHYTTLEHDSLKIWPERDRFMWFSQQFGGDSMTWLTQHTGLDAKTASQELDNFLAQLFLESEPNVVPYYPIGSRKYCSYFEKRNITPETAENFELEVTNEGVIVPLYNILGKRCGSLLRREHTDINYLKYRKLYAEEPSPLWPYSHLKDRSKPLFIFEGAWSVMRWTQVCPNINALALIGTYVDKQVLGLLNRRSPILILDNDTSGAGDIVKQQFDHYFPGLDSFKFNTYPDEMDDEQIRRRVNYAIRERRKTLGKIQ